MVFIRAVPRGPLLPIRMGQRQQNESRRSRAVTESANTEKNSGARHALLAGFLGWTLDAFDFFVVVFLYDTLAHQFGVPKKSIVFTVTATLALRPLGALLFGLMSDRYGRSVPLMLNVLYFSIIEVLCGFSPNYTFFLVMRALFGIGMGGEWGVGASLAMEAAPVRLRGILSGILQSGYTLGICWPPSLRDFYCRLSVGALCFGPARHPRFSRCTFAQKYRSPRRGSSIVRQPPAKCCALWPANGSASPILWR